MPVVTHQDLATLSSRARAEATSQRRYPSPDSNPELLEELADALDRCRGSRMFAIQRIEAVEQQGEFPEFTIKLAALLEYDEKGHLTHNYYQLPPRVRGLLSRPWETLRTELREDGDRLEFVLDGMSGNGPAR